MRVVTVTVLALHFLYNDRKELFFISIEINRHFDYIIERVKIT